MISQETKERLRSASALSCIRALVLDCDVSYTFSRTQQGHLQITLCTNKGTVRTMVLDRNVATDENICKALVGVLPGGRELDEETKKALGL